MDNDADAPIQVPPELANSAEFPPESAAANEASTDVPSVESAPTAAVPEATAENPAVDAAEPSESPATEEQPPPSVPQIQRSDVQEVVSAETEKLLSKMAELQAAFDSKLRYDEKKQAIIDRQAAELESFKKGLLEKSTLAFAQDLIAEVDSAEKLARYYEAAECTEDNFRKLKKALKDVSLSLCDILEKYGILSYRTEPGETFDPRRQRARLTTKTGDKALDKTVKALLGAGFEQERDDGASTKVLRPELVDVYVFDPSLVPAPETGPAPTEPAEAETPKPESAPAQNAAAGTPEPAAEAT
jgi:molecular chaperone GrpE (heat shock protein)